MAFKKDDRPMNFHGNLAKLGPVRVTVDEKPKYLDKKERWIVKLTLHPKGEEPEKVVYWCENDACVNTFKGKEGRTFTVVFEGREDEATVTNVGGQVADPSDEGQEQPAPRQPAAVGRNIPLGTTVGMAVKCACESLSAQGKQLAPLEVTNIASDILRVSEWLEQGHLAAPYKDRMAKNGAQPQAAAPTPTPPPAPPKPKCGTCGADIDASGFCSNPKCSTLDVPF